MAYYKKITGERIYLSPTDKEETGSYICWMNDRAVAEPFGEYGRINGSQEDLGWIYRPPEHMQRYAIVLLEGDELIGSISIHNIDHLNRNAFIGIFIGSSEHRGKGLGGEALRLILDYGFRTLNLRSIGLSVHEDNPGAIACYKKAGFREVGRLPEWVFKDGRYVDKLYMCVTKREFIG